MTVVKNIVIDLCIYPLQTKTKLNFIVKLHKVGNGKENASMPTLLDCPGVSLIQAESPGYEEKCLKYGLHTYLGRFGIS